MQQLEQDRRNFELKLEERNRNDRRITNWIMGALAVGALLFAFMEVAAAVLGVGIGILGLTNDSWIVELLREFFVR